MPVILGGGIGAGKSSVGAIFAHAGFEVIEADAVGRDVLAPGRPAVDEVAARWPDTVSDGVVDRAALAAIVFADRSELAALEAVTHPRIADEIRTRMTSASARVLIEVPVMSVLAGVDAVRVAVIADDEVRIARAVARGDEPGDVAARMASQVDQDAWRAWADVVVDNSGSWADTERHVLAVIEELVDG